MGYSAQVVQKVREEFENKRTRAVGVSDEHRQQAYLKCPVLREIDHALSMTGLSVYRASLAGKEGLEDRIAAIMKENLELQASKRKLLKDAGFPEDYTDIKYECDKCNDTGYVGINMCRCMKKALVREAYNSSGLGKLLTGQTFENFDLSYYSDQPDDDGTIPKVTMKKNLECAKQFVEDFGVAGKESNLLFMGTTGLGKTHLTTAIAKGVIDKGFDVVYDSAQNIIRAFEQERFEKNEYAEDNVDRYFKCDLLIVDDLGTEFRNTFTQSSLYNLLNTRINSGKCMIFSTNMLDMAEVLNVYDDRITSRLIGSFKLFKFAGRDIRLLKSKIAKDSKNNK